MTWYNFQRREYHFQRRVAPKHHQVHCCPKFTIHSLTLIQHHVYFIVDHAFTFVTNVYLLDYLSLLTVVYIYIAIIDVEINLSITPTLFFSVQV